MSEFFKKPMTKIIIPFVLGILYYNTYFVFFSALFALMFCLLSMFILHFTFAIRRALKWKPVFLFFTILFYFFLGICFSEMQNPVKNKFHYRYFVNHKVQTLLFKPLSFPEKKNNRLRIEAEIKGVYFEGIMNQCEGKTFLYLPSDCKNVPQFNDQWLGNFILTVPNGPLEPEGFSYFDYCSNKNILFLSYLKDKNSLIKIQSNKNPFINCGTQVRNFILSQVDNAVKNAESSNLIKAMLLGVDEELTSDLKNAFSATGTIHILSVSGMHTGLIFALLNFIIGLWIKNSKWLWLKNGLIIIILWLFVFITGFSPPAIRAAFMLSLILIAAILVANADTMNVLLVSAFICLLMDTKLIFDVGFQLSYAAVAGIVFFLQYLKWLVNFSNYWMEKIWILLCTSFAAQIFTLPIILYTFHTFPNYFLLSNLIIVPLSGLLMYGSIALCLFSPIPFLQSILGAALDYLCRFLTMLVNFMADLPFATNQFIYLSKTQIVLVWVIIIFCGYAFLNRNRFFLFLSLYSLFVFALAGVIYQMELMNVRSTSLMNKNGNLRIENIQKGIITFWQHSSGSSGYFSFSHLNRYHSFQRRQFLVQPGLTLASINGRNYYWFSHYSFENTIVPIIKADYIIIDKVQFLSDQVLRKVNPSKVFLCNLSISTLNHFRFFCEKNKISYEILSKNSFLKLPDDS
jgi:competence protein ComEC